MLAHLHEPLYILAVAGLGLFAGIMGGMLGVGGSSLMIPGLVILFGRPYQHVYQAAAMIANVAVALPASLRHKKAGYLIPRVLRYLIPAGVICVMAGVAVSNLSFFSDKIGSIRLGRVLAVFLIYTAVNDLLKLRGDTKEHNAVPDDSPHITPARSTCIGGAMGFLGGLLGVGGGVIAVPLQQIWMKIPLKLAIANSAAAMILTAAVGAAYKNATVYQHQAPWYGGLLLAAVLVPTAWIGGKIGAVLTHRLPVRQVRIAFILLMLFSAWKMAAIQEHRL
jgi:uncharacterized protein